MRVLVKVKWASIETIEVPDHIIRNHHDPDALNDYLADHIGDIVSDPEPVDWEIVG